MKNSTPTWLCLLTALLMLNSASLSAQANQASEVIITQKVTREDGSTVTVKKTFPAGQDWETYLKALEQEGEAQQLDMQIEVVEQTEGSEENNTVFRFRSANPNSEMTEEQRKEWQENSIIYQEKAEKWQEHAKKWAEKAEKWENHDFAYQHHGDGEERPFLGVYPGTPEEGNGVLLEGIVEGSGAQAAGLQTGDILTAINGVALERGGLTPTLAQYKPGETISVTYLREGQERQTQVTLTKKSTPGYSWSRERDPCDVFIGVYTSGYYEEGQKGRRITSVIKGTSAEEAALEAGDVIIALDGVPVTTHEETITERDKHSPGDYYTITYLREGVLSEVEAQFRPCGEENTVEEPVVEEIVTEKDLPNNSGPVQGESNLQLFSWSAFPNPTLGKITVTFQAEARPTTVQVVDVAGKVIYNEVLNNFDGFYNKELNLSKAAPGALFIQVRQGEQVMVEKIMLLNRA